jgi:hypothetical protein
MAEHDLGFKLRQDGSIDIDAYRADAARERSEVRSHLIWEVVSHCSGMVQPGLSPKQ